MTNMQPMDVLENQANSQRQRLHDDMSELRARLRETLHPKRVAREYLLPISGAAALVGLTLGYVLVGIFTRD